MSALHTRNNPFRPLPITGRGLRIFRFKDHDVITEYDNKRKSAQNLVLVLKVLFSLGMTAIAYCCINNNYLVASILSGLTFCIGLMMIKFRDSEKRFIFDYKMKMYYANEDSNPAQVNPLLGGSFDEIEALVLRKKITMHCITHELLLKRYDGIEVIVMVHTNHHDNLYKDVVVLADRLGKSIINEKSAVIYKSDKDTVIDEDKLKHYIAPNYLNTRMSLTAKVASALASGLIILNMYSIWLNLSDNNPPHPVESYSESELKMWFKNNYSARHGDKYRLVSIDKIVAAPRGNNKMDLHVRYNHIEANENTSVITSDRTYLINILKHR